MDKKQKPEHRFLLFFGASYAVVVDFTEVA
ncbi:Uncharacterised protein [Pseudomonas fluorescens]|uniref:Uncharacterized protein n=1 Tax=Pseudomonas fluorescens TaxID=294 RepID=A0A448DUW2_PSEFL|nr:Uncharacterised protein [Pseudomonas fluorescens]